MAVPCYTIVYRILMLVWREIDLGTAIRPKSPGKPPKTTLISLLHAIQQERARLSDAIAMRRRLMHILLAILHPELGGGR